MKKILGLLMATAMFVAASSIFACPGSKNKDGSTTKETRTQVELPAKA